MLKTSEQRKQELRIINKEFFDSKITFGKKECSGIKFKDRWFHVVQKTSFNPYKNTDKDYQWKFIKKSRKKMKRKKIIQAIQRREICERCKKETDERYRNMICETCNIQ